VPEKAIATVLEKALSDFKRATEERERLHGSFVTSPVFVE
jgi:hypothetical protein